MLPRLILCISRTKAHHLCQNTASKPIARQPAAISSFGCGVFPVCAKNIEPDKGYWIAHSIQYRGGPGTIDLNNPWLPAAENPRVMPVNCSVCTGTCWDRDWAQKPGQAGGGPGTKCTPMASNITHAKSIGPCDIGCDCVPPSNSYVPRWSHVQLVHSTQRVSLVFWPALRLWILT